jgi:molybdopterin molybdotransferase
LPVELRAADECLGFYLAAPLAALRTNPQAPLSAMDGYALRAADLPGPWRVIGESAAGHPWSGALAPGEAIRISTGAIVPASADMVLLQEDSLRNGDALTLTGNPPSPTERHIRPAGMDFALAAPLLAPGTRLGAAQIALAIAGGHTHLPVRRAAKVAIIDSGDELAALGTAPGSAQIPASNGAMLALMAAQVPVVISRHGPVPDRLEALVAAFDAARDADVIVTSGGASVGDHDLIRPALEAAGATLGFWRVGIKPGKPLLVAQRGHQVILGLPGNPASAFVTAYLFMLPLLRAALGAFAPLPRAFRSALADDMPAGGSRMEFLRAHWDGETVTLGSLQDSGMLTPLANANVLVQRAAGAPLAPAGTFVPIYLIENGGYA